MYENELYHYGVKGMKWGHRKRYDPVGIASANRRGSSAYGNVNSSRDAYKQARQQYRAAKKAERQTPEAKAERIAKAKKAAKIGAAVAATALATYGAYKLNKYVKTKNAQIAAKRGFEASEKIFQSLRDNAYKQVSSGQSTRASVNVNSGLTALNDARNSYSDNFRTAARNVINYKRSGGNLNSLRSLNEYRGLGDNRVTFGR